ncbi:hypothetical protein I7I50_07410 [Histoplasma capsulatum G186AR]|uniref:Uncharacterized protein n=1 Tax=Ajellomyces capsulatus TaxID=5037 RepID=A0A8H7Z165_AJECA|nr:hypothetical protein I7I52_09518 [Histoplasma capsulatum]QSS68117.1 hypothetical protein I7I50_07410 [Histoplasma capsulatum G186AR]
MIIKHGGREGQVSIYNKGQTRRKKSKEIVHEPKLKNEIAWPSDARVNGKWKNRPTGFQTPTRDKKIKNQTHISIKSEDPLIKLRACVQENLRRKKKEMKKGKKNERNKMDLKGRKWKSDRTLLSSQLPPNMS